ncbi:MULTISPECIES: MarR family winged helix-turn-helix transcriptional regulator [Streptomyces]|uniref:MarR family winged helix-turn-helix transcriptional regulator n=1 Tax=Streptomyces TaxID=1883 RepID=UPI002248891F|nr:MarR family winged helix-turn-helix transcriptional regulator [Streptomyces sp. JHD 1]MCX2968834.1 MarR family winged helix-turn-helix transcriptional regulator [Streptomyces sp. JHD 1]
MERRQESGTESEPDAREVAAVLVRLWERTETASDEPLSRAQRRTLAVVGTVGRATPGLLGARLGAAAPSVSRLCGRLESAGLLARSPPPGDQRRTAYVLTAAGRRMLGQTRARRLAVLGHALRGGDPARRRQLAAAFRELREALTAAVTREPPPSHPDHCPP